MAGSLVIDGSHGEGGGQILRTAVSIAAVTGRPLRIEKIRTRRPNAGLAAQHVTAVRAAAAVCGAALTGDRIGSAVLEFVPQGSPQAGVYAFDVGATRPGGSAGASTLVIQAVVPVLLAADGDSTVAVRGGTHVEWSPPYDYLQDVWLSALRSMGASIDCALRRSGWYPVGQGEIEVHVRGLGAPRGRLRGLHLEERGALRRVSGRALVAELPLRIADRMAERATGLLKSARLRARVKADRVAAACPGAGIFLTAEYEPVCCGFNALGRQGKPAEAVASKAVADLLRHHAAGGTVDIHLADQLLVPMALADRPSVFTVESVSSHLETNAWVIERFGLAKVDIARRKSAPAVVTISPLPWA
jgi:RNA 3'-terminal phosphate cyclase (ATP)